MRKIWAIASALVLMVLAVTGTATSASAATRGNAYVVINNSVCQGGEQVRNILINNSTAGVASQAWDYGDNVVYPQVLLGTRNNLQIQAECYKRVGWFFWQPTSYRTVVATIYPSANQQTFFVG